MAFELYNVYIYALYLTIISSEIVEELHIHSYVARCDMGLIGLVWVWELYSSLIHSINGCLIDLISTVLFALSACEPLWTRLMNCSPLYF